MKGMNMLDFIVMLLLVVGGLNWGLVGAFNFNIVELLFGFYPMVVRVVYVLVGLAAVYMLYGVFVKGKES